MVAVTALELIESRTTPACDRRWTGIEANNTAGHRYLALAARWKGIAVGGVALEIRHRTAVVRMLHVDEAWRQRGIGRRLLRGLLRQASFQFVSDVYVLVTVADAGFYALHRFRLVDEQEDARGPSNRFDFAGLNERATDDGDHTEGLCK